MRPKNWAQRLNAPTFRRKIKIKDKNKNWFQTPFSLRRSTEMQEEFVMKNLCNVLARNRLTIYIGG